MEVDGMDDAEEAGGLDDLTLKANALVRLALFSESKRTALRREEIAKKVLGGSARQFGAVLAIAQKTLRDTFGMELVELPSRAALDKEANGDKDAELEDAQKATGVKKRATAAGSKTYILRSTLDPLIIEYAALSDSQIIEQEAAEMPSDDEEDDAAAKRYGSIISWSQCDQLGAIGIAYVILALILGSGRVMNDSKSFSFDLRASLRRLNLDEDVQMSGLATHEKVPIDTFLGHLARQGYIERTAVGEPSKKGKGAKRGRPTQGADDEGAQYEWRWGARALCEVGERKVAQFVGEFMAGGDGEEEEESEAAQAEMEARRDRIMKGIERAAGGALMDVK
ncbi:MAGE-domain-containing protein [Schizophyllum commune H4-8]|uniref:MAGE-domain-containing protein n=1 Tax=Schizophyllum commune (strain H4-8 / FGSC 9210) TaxID=578458 RepID=UPI00215F0411|nr:MAGE-domain-containing protein [Schizophyllum commune H4-8]KAI5891750.1 MAGE-domain-containing protein [Schizophyllum commune H4-8]